MQNQHKDSNNTEDDEVRHWNEAEGGTCGCVCIDGSRPSPWTSGTDCIAGLVGRVINLRTPTASNAER